MYDDWVTEIPGKELDLFVMPVAPLDVNASILVHRESGEGILVDPGGEADELQEFIKKKGIRLRHVLLTHAHFDHILAVDEMTSFIKEESGAVSPFLYLHPEDLFLYRSVGSSAGRFGISVSEMKTEPDGELKDGQELIFPGFQIQVLHTPGHSPGSCCFFLPEEGFCITGDTLFAGSVGRTDLPGGNMSVLRKSIREKLFVLPKTTRVIPGHGPLTDIGNEKNTNPFV